MRLRTTGSSHTGLREWLLQRVTAIYMSAFVLYLVFRFAIAPITTYSAWTAWFTLSTVRIAFALFFASVLVHSWIGMRSVFMDYVKPMWVRFIVQLVTATVLLVIALWSLQIIFDSRLQ